MVARRAAEVVGALLYVVVIIPALPFLWLGAACVGSLLGARDLWSAAAVATRRRRPEPPEPPEDTTRRPAV